MLERIKEQPLVGKLTAQYDQLPRRDQQALMVLAIAVFLGILYFAIWQPAASFHDQAISDRESAEQLLAWMDTNKPALQRLAGGASGQSGSSVNKPEDARALMALVTRTAGDSGLALQRFEPSGDDAIRVWLDQVPFSQVAGWLEQLNIDNGVEIEQASMDRQDEPGMVSVRLTLTI
ncbi:type II secretion system protein M [Marinobacter sp. CHS3-4]|uniref:type II secretion system protein M n=1 Tax=Marinobacter sp. CHS3-4 TaxID=3045174 RepID=UPI0024B616C9|nr:type II secretion system protein M [Marinobacter sp. CHS3-4]MDI9245301.1 type II secretion system protein M [Marinobacter sp. CHS3-4]